MNYTCKNKTNGNNTDLCELRQCKECEKIDKIQRLKNKLGKLKSILYSESDIKKSFYGGMVGFKKGLSKRKHENSVNRELNQYIELKDVEEKINKLENPIKRSKSKLIDPKTLKIGDKKYWFGIEVEVIKVNKKTVTIQTLNGYKEAVKPNLLD